MPGQNLLSHQPPLPVLLRQRTVRPRRSTTGAAGAPGPRPGYLGRPAVRPAGAGRRPVRRPRAVADHRPPADHRCRGRRDRGRVPDPARRAHLGAGRSRRPAPLVGQAVPVRAEGGPRAAPAGGLARAPLRPPAAGGRPARGGAGGRRVRGQPADDARARAGLPGRTAAGDARRRWQRDPARRPGRRRGGVPGPGLGLALPQPAARPAERRAGGPRRAPGRRRVALRRGDRRGDRGPAPRTGMAARGLRHRGPGPSRAAPEHAVVPAAAGGVPADRRAGQRAHGRGGGGARRDRPGRPRGDAGRLQRGGGSGPDGSGRQTGRAGQGAGPAAVLAHRLLGPASAGLPGADADPRRAGGRGGDRAGAPARRHRGAGPVRGGPQRGRPLLALLRQRALPGRLRLLRPPGRAACRGGRASGVRARAGPAADQRR